MMDGEELLRAGSRGKARLFRQLGDDGNVAQQRHRAGAHPVLDHGVEHRLDDAGARAVEGEAQLSAAAFNTCWMYWICLTCIS